MIPSLTRNRLRRSRIERFVHRDTRSVPLANGAGGLRFLPGNDRSVAIAITGDSEAVLGTCTTLVTSERIQKTSIGSS